MRQSHVQPANFYGKATSFVNFHVYFQAQIPNIKNTNKTNIQRKKKSQEKKNIPRNQFSLHKFCVRHKKMLTFSITSNFYFYNMYHLTRDLFQTWKSQLFNLKVFWMHDLFFSSEHCHETNQWSMLENFIPVRIS